MDSEKIHASLDWVAKKRIFHFWHYEALKENLHWYELPWKFRYTRLLFMLLGVISSTSLIYSWQPFSSMLYKNKTYSWLCTEEQIRSFSDSLQMDTKTIYDPICPSQRDSVNILFSIFSAAEFIFGAIAGVSLDYLGPFLTGCVGQLLLSIGLIIFTCSSEVFQAYIPAVLLVGASANFIVYPTFAVSDYYPKYETLIISAIVAFQNGGSVITTILEALYRSTSLTFKQIFIIYLLGLLLPVGILYLLSLPLIRLKLNYNELEKIKRYYSEKKKLDTSKAQLAKKTSTPTSHSLNQHDGSRTTIISKMNNSLNDEFQPNINLVSFQNSSTKEAQKNVLNQNVHGIQNRPSYGSQEKLHALKSLEINESDNATHQMEEPKNTSQIPLLSNVSKTSLLEENQHESKFDHEKFPITVDSQLVNKDTCEKKLNRDFDNFTTLKKCVISLDYLLLIFIVVIVTLQYSYYPVILKDLSLEIARYNGYIYPSQALWGLVYGYIVVYTKTLPIQYFLFIMIGIVYWFHLISNTVLNYIATTIFVLGSTYAFSTKFTFVSETYPPKYNGVLVGILSIASGSTLGINILLTTYAPIRSCMICLLAFVFVGILLTLWLHFRQHKLKKEIRKNLLTHQPSATNLL